MPTTTSRSIAVLIFITAGALGTIPPSAQAGKIVCWKNNEGIRECGNSVPPEFSQKSVERKSAMGVTLEKTDRAKTAEELEKRRAEAERLRVAKAEQERIDTEPKRKDLVLLQTFTTEEDLKLARDGKVARIVVDATKGTLVGGR